MYVVRHVPDCKERWTSARFATRKEPTLPDRDSITIPVKLPNKAVIHIEATALRGLNTGQEVVDLQQVFSFKAIREAIQGITWQVTHAIESTRPQKASVEFGIDVGVKNGKLTAMLVKGGGNTHLKITLEWGAVNQAKRAP